MESGIDIKFPSFALAVAKLRMGRGDHHRGDSDDVHAAGRECHLNSAGEKYSVLGSNICTGTLPLVGCCRSQPNQPTKPLMNWKEGSASKLGNFCYPLGFRPLIWQTDLSARQGRRKGRKEEGWIFRLPKTFSGLPPFSHRRSLSFLSTSSN